MTRERLAGLFGGLIVIVALAFVCLRLWHNRSEVIQWQPAYGDYLVLALGSIVYAANGALLSIAWFLLLRAFLLDFLA